MSIDLWNPLDLFSLRVYKRLAGRQDLVWANTYELQVRSNAEGGGSEQARIAAEFVAGFEATFHLSDVVFDRAVFSTLVPDGQPYDPDTFASYGLAGIVGTRPSGAPMSLQNCLLVRKEVKFGRAGRFLYRRCLDESEVSAASGDPVLTPTAATSLNTTLSGPVGTEESFIAGLASVGLDLVMAGIAGGVQRVRAVSGLTAAGVTVKPYNNRYFDRA